MFIFPEKTFTNYELDRNILRDIIDKKHLSIDYEGIKHVVISNILNKNTLEISSKGNIKEIYVIKIKLKEIFIPKTFMSLLENFVNIPVLYILEYKNLVNYAISLKKQNNLQQNEIIRTFLTGWGQKINKELPNSDNLEDLFLKIVEIFTNLKFDSNETYEHYIKRLIAQNVNDNNIYKGHANYEIENFVFVTTKLWNSSSAQYVFERLDYFILHNFTFDIINAEQFDELLKKELLSNYAKHYYTTVFKINYSKIMESIISNEILQDAFYKSVKIKYENKETKRFSSVGIVMDDLLYHLGIALKQDNNKPKNNCFKNKTIKRPNVNKKIIRTKLTPEELKKYFN